MVNIRLCNAFSYFLMPTPTLVADLLGGQCSWALPRAHGLFLLGYGEKQNTSAISDWS